MRMKRIVLLLICVVISTATYADIGDVIRAISNGSKITIELKGREVDISTRKFISEDELVRFNFTPNGSDFDGNRAFGINMVNSNLKFYGHKFIFRKYEDKLDDWLYETYVFESVDNDVKHRLVFSLSVAGGNPMPELAFGDGKGGTRVFLLGYCRVIGEDGSILLPEGTWIMYTIGKEKLKKMLDAIVQTF